MDHPFLPEHRQNSSASRGISWTAATAAAEKNVKNCRNILVTRQRTATLALPSSAAGKRGLTGEGSPPCTRLNAASVLPKHNNADSRRPVGLVIKRLGCDFGRIFCAYFSCEYIDECLVCSDSDPSFRSAQTPRVQNMRSICKRNDCVADKLYKLRCEKERPCLLSLIPLRSIGLCSASSALEAVLQSPATKIYDRHCQCVQFLANYVLFIA